MKARVLSKGISVVALIVSGTVEVQSQSSFQGLGFLTGHQESFVSDISSDGSTIVGVSGSGSNYRAFRWTASAGMQDLGVLLGWTNSVASSVSDDGSLVAGHCANGANTRAVRWSGLGIFDLGTLVANTSSASRGISGDGSVVAGLSGNRAFRWTSSIGLQDLGTLPGGGNSAANSVSKDGSTIVGWSQSSIGTRPFRWTSVGGMQDIGAIQSGFNQATGVSFDGSTVVGYGASSSTNIPRAFRWSNNSGIQNLGTLPGAIDSSAYGVSEDGSMVVGFSDSPVGGAFFWRKDMGMVNVVTLFEEADLGNQISGWDFASANSIVVVGESVSISGNGYFGGQFQAFTSRIPIPALHPTSFAVINGSLLGGSLNSLFRSDGNAVFILNDEQSTQGVIEVSATSPSDSVSSLYVTLVSRSTRADLSQFTDSFNYQSNNWVNVNFSLSSLNYLTSKVQVPNPNQHIGQTAALRFRVRFIPIVDIESVDGWGEEIDQMTWTVIP